MQKSRPTSRSYTGYSDIHNADRTIWLEVWLVGFKCDGYTSDWEARQAGTTPYIVAGLTGSATYERERDVHEQGEFLRRSRIRLF